MLFSKKKQEKAPQVSAQATEVLEIGNVQKPQQSNDEKELQAAAEHYNKRYDGLFNPENTVNVHGITELNLLFAIYAELRKLNELIENK